MIMKDQNKTRVNKLLISAYSIDRNVMPVHNTTYYQIILTVGSATVKCQYDSLELRDSDIETLDSESDIKDS